MTQPTTKASYAKCYHYISDCYADMSTPELRVTLALERELIGYHQTSKKITWAQLQELTGIKSKTTLSKGITAACERGFFNCVDGIWHICGTESVPDGTVNVPLSHTDGTENVLPAVQKVYRNGTKSVPPTTSPKETLKKEYKDNKSIPLFIPPSPKPTQRQQKNHETDSQLENYHTITALLDLWIDHTKSRPTKKTTPEWYQSLQDMLEVTGWNVDVAFKQMQDSQLAAAARGFNADLPRLIVPMAVNDMRTKTAVENGYKATNKPLTQYEQNIAFLQELEHESETNQWSDFGAVFDFVAGKLPTPEYQNGNTQGVVIDIAGH